MIDLRLPNITGATEREQLQQIKSYLHQTVEQLNWALNNIDTQSNTAVVVPTARSLAPAPSGSVSQSDPQATFASIKSLIIKSAEIVDAYYDEINTRLEGLYVAQSDFGTYVEETAAKIEANSKDITTTFTNIQTLDSKVGGIDTTVQTLDSTVTTLDGTVQTLDSTIQDVDGKVDTVAEEASTNLHDATVGLQGNMDALAGVVDGHTTAIQDVKDGTDKSIKAVKDDVDGLSGEIDTVKYDVDEKTKALDEAIKATNTVVATVTGTIKTGELYTDEMGLPVYGLEIGQRNTIDGVEIFNAYARFTSNRLSFFDAGGQEVAYISDSKLYITQAEITSSFKLGGFVDTVMSNGNVVTKWVGGN